MDLLDEFLNKKYQYKRPSYYHAKSLITPFLNFLRKKASKDLSNFDEDEIVLYLLEERSDLTSYTRKQILHEIRRFVRWFYGHKVDANDEAEQRLRLMRITDIRLPKMLQEGGRKALTLKELERLLETAKIWDERDFHVLYLLGYFGFRPIELEKDAEISKQKQESGIKDIDWNAQSIEVVGGRTKRLRLLFFDDTTAGILLKAMEKNWRALPHERAIKYKTLFEDIDFIPYCLRHTFNTHMRKRIKDRLLKVLMGHTTKDMTDYYDDAFRNEIKEAMISKHYYKSVNLPL